MRANRQAPKLEVRDSSLGEEAGKGLFACEHIKKGAHLGYYTGEILTRSQLEARETPSAYVFECERNLYIDAEKSDCLMRYVNVLFEDKATPLTLEYNCRSCYNNRRKSLRFVALRDIQPGEELF